MKQSLFIEQIMVLGENEKMPCAFIQPNFENLSKWASDNNIELPKSREELVKHQKVIDLFQKELTNSINHLVIGNK